MEEVLGTCVDRGIKVVTNAGGLNPAGLADQVRHAGRPARPVGGRGPRRGRRPPAPPRRAARPTATRSPTSTPAQPLADAAGPVVSANAYLGGWPIVEALDGGADVVVCPRVTDASLVVGPAAWHHGWGADRLGPRWPARWWPATSSSAAPRPPGGNYAFFTEVPGLEHPGFPIAEVAADGSSVITKHPGTGGAVSVGHGHRPAALRDRRAPLPQHRRRGPLRHHRGRPRSGPDRVRLSGHPRRPAPPDVKVCLNLLGGWRNSMTFVLTGLDIEAKAALTVRSLGRRPRRDRASSPSSTPA